MIFHVPGRVRFGGAVSAITAAFSMLACGGTSSTGDAQTTSALGTETADGAELAPCLTSYAECVRAGSETATCHDTLRACARPPGRDGAEGPRPPLEGREGGERDCDGDGGRPERPEGDGDRPRPPLPPPEGEVGGPRACFEALDACARGTDEVASCVSGAVACLSALPKPPRREGGEPRAREDGAIR